MLLRKIIFYFIVFFFLLLSFTAKVFALDNILYFTSSVLYPTATQQVPNAKSTNSFAFIYEKELWHHVSGNIQIGKYNLTMIDTKLGIIANRIIEENLRVDFGEIGINLIKPYNKFSVFIGSGICFYKAYYDCSKEGHSIFGTIYFDDISDVKTTSGIYFTIGGNYLINKKVLLKLSTKKTWAKLSYGQDEMKWSFGESEINDLGGISVDFAIGYVF